MKIDWKKLKAAIAADTNLIRAKKRDGYHGGSLSYEKLIATRHHAIAAHFRGRIHLSGRFLCAPRAMGLSERYEPCFMRDGMTTEEQGKFIEKELVNFLLPETPTEQPAA